MSETKKLREVTDPSQREHYYRYSPDRDRFEFRYTTLGGWVRPCHDLLNENPAFIRLMADLKENPYVTTVTRPRVIPDPRVNAHWNMRYVDGRFQVADKGADNWFVSAVGSVRVDSDEATPELLEALADLKRNPTEEVEA